MEGIGREPPEGPAPPVGEEERSAMEKEESAGWVGLDDVGENAIGEEPCMREDPPEGMEWCDVCATYRTRLRPDTGWCHVCYLTAKVEKERRKCEAVLDRLPLAERMAFEEAREKGERSAASSEYASSRGAACGQQDGPCENEYVLEERRQLARLKAEYDSERSRLRRLRAKEREIAEKAMDPAPAEKAVRRRKRRD